MLNALLPNSLPINNVSIFKVDSGNSRAISIPGGRKREKIAKIPIYILVAKVQCKTTDCAILKTEDNAHIFHQQIPQQKTKNSPGNSAETIKTRGKQETIHSPTNTINQHIQNCDQGSKRPEISQ